MNTTAHLWAIGYDDVARADQVREVISKLAWNTGGGESYLILQDIAVVVRHSDGSCTLDHQPLPAATNIAGCSLVGLLAGAVVAAPLTGASIGALIGSVGTAISALTKGISQNFIREVEGMMRPGTSALFVLDHVGDMDVILHTIQGLGGKLIKTNVDVERAKLIQSTLAASVEESQQGDSYQFPKHCCTSSNSCDRG
jgi:uncharacterized membrane protein